jgi:DNA-binding LacI/PurR family transcriptional regulator
MLMDDRRKRVNIKDVARLAGVSPTTVSHALGGQRPVSSATRERVQQAVAQLGYRPHPGARSLKASGTGVIALCAVNAISEAPYANLEYYFRLMHTVTEVAHEEGYALVVVPSENSDRYWDRLLVDGAVISDPAAGDPNIAFLRGQGLPFVTIGRDPDAPAEGYWVDDDNDLETRAMLDHLLERGAGDIALVTWPTTDYWTKTGIAAYRAWCDTHGMTPRVEEVREQDEDPLGEAARRLLDPPGRPDAVYGLYEVTAIAVLHRAAELGIKVPEELMVAGPGDYGIALRSSPPMTTLEYDVERQGREAACILIRLIRGAPVDEPHLTVPFTIAERDSTRR